MPKKHASQARREFHGPEDLRRLAETLQKLAADAIALANRVASECDGRTIEVDGATKARSGIRSVELYYMNVEMAISKDKKTRLN